MFSVVISILHHFSYNKFPKLKLGDSMSALSEQLHTFEEAQALVRRDDALESALEQVSKVDFAMVRLKLVEETGWTLDACDEAESLYRKFLALNIRYPDRKLCPNGPVDEFWHAHILDTQQYAADCAALFGQMLHHYPYFGMRGADDRANLERAFADTVDLFIRHFGIDPTAGDCVARSCKPQRCP
jgi:hypothetical protein